MAQYKILIWNANGFMQHGTDLKNYLGANDTDIILFSEIHFTWKSHFKIPNYKIYDTRHPSGSVHGSAIIIKKKKTPSSIMCWRNTKQNTFKPPA